MLKATPQLNKIFTTCSEKTLSPKVTELVRFAAHLANCNSSATGAGGSHKAATAAGASQDELLCAACLSACAGGPTTQAAFAAVHKTDAAKPFAHVKADALDKKTTHLVSLAACLVSGCECAAGHIVEARLAGAKDEELARAACLAACARGLTAKWRFAAALQCAGAHRACAC